MPDAKPVHKRILLKLSGESLMGDDQFGINRNTIARMVEEVAEVTRLGVQVAVVIGGEGPGLAEDVLATADARVTIPMNGTIESLNVAVAAALLLYEARRQRAR